jgi:outer membrane protein
VRPTGICIANVNAKDLFMRLSSYLARALCRSTVTLVAWLAASGPGVAQSLKDLYESARSYDAAYLAAHALAGSARYSLEQSQALRWPTVGLSASAGYEDLRSGPADRLSSNVYQANIDAEQWLFNRSNSATIAQAEKLAIVAQADLQAAEQDLIVRLAQAYFDLLAAQDAQTTAQANKKAIAEQLASAKRNFESGSATITDSREAQARYDLAVAQEVAADNDLRIRPAALDQLVGRNAVAPQALKVPVPLPPLVPGNPEEWIRFVDTAPAVRKAQLTHDVAKLETHKASVAGWPTLKLTGSMGVSRGSEADTLNTTGNIVRGSVALALQMPLYSGGAISSRQKETVALEDQSRNALDVARRLAAAATRRAFLGVQSGLAQVRALEAAESSSKLALEATKVGYRVGVRVNLDVLNAQTQLFATQRDLARARYDLIVNHLKLRQAAGVLAANDVEATSALLSK